MSNRQYITTAIDYPNAPPHMGHVLEKVLADVCARWLRLRGNDVRFQIGTDEHGIKIQQTADREKMTPQQLVDRNVPLFRDLYAKLNISADDFVRTTDTVRHWPTVVELWKRLHAAGALEKRTYTGLYCAGCERFITKKELIDGNCPIHQKPPEEVQEENWFFLLKREAAWLKKLLTQDTDGTRIVPQFRERETLALLEQGLEDVSFSRPKSSLGWGIPVPDDADQVMYVWCDALTNYISTLDYFHPESKGRMWWDDAQVTHVIGKDIARFHALYWPAMLKQAGVKKMPDRLLMHGFLTSEGEKMSKSIGNVVNPEDVLQKFNGNPDPIRFYLSHEIPVGNDGDFSWKRFQELYDAKLRNQLGNGLNRVLVLMNKDDSTVEWAENDPFSIAHEWERYTLFMTDFDISNGIGLPFVLASILDKEMARLQPWTLKGMERKTILSNFAELLRHISLMLLPFMPDTAHRIAKQLNVSYADQMLEKNFTIEPWKGWGADTGWKKVGTPEILFAPLEK